MNPRTAKLLKWFGYPIYAVLALFFCFYWAFPAERARSMAEDILSTGGRTVTIGGLSISALSSATLENVVVRMAPEPERTTRPGAKAPQEGAGTEKKKPMRLVIDRVDVSVGVLALMRGGLDVGYDVEAMGGRAHGRYIQEKKAGFELELELEGLAARRIPWLQAAGPPVKGTISGKVSLASPSMKRFNKLSGDIDLECAACSFGDDKGKIKVPGNPMMAQGLTVPHIPLGRLTLRLKAQKGVIELEQVAARSKDVDLQAEGKITLRSPLTFSMIEAYVRIKISEALKKKNDKFSVIDLAFADGKRSDGFIGVLIRGIARGPKVKGSKLGPGKGRSRSPSRAGRPRRGR